ncbi:MAG: hypothetical protein ACD_20C00287G0016 [uncultured bacterium]|nr:MAG: hypothetical protein ACD_20C00287G0016 [uncultured bacterium]HBH18256.1 hypothetical protein [Cyanobacteria bacterium UBA9579]
MSLNLLEAPKSEFTEQKFIKFLRAQGITVKTNTKARGNSGVCFKNRIDISTRVSEEKRLTVLAHEYAHKIHYDLEKECFYKGGTIEKLFKTSEVDIFQQELMNVTNFVDKNSLFERFYSRKAEIKTEIKDFEVLIKIDYPDFKRTESFSPINSYFKKNKTSAKYLLQYDNVRITQPVFKKEEFYSIKTLDEDFPKIPESLRAYIKLKSREREYKRLYRLKNKAENYYKKPTELFARLIEGIFIDNTKIQEIAPVVYARFIELMDQKYYGNLKDLFILAGIDLK